MKRQCWSNSQYSRRECLEVTGIPDSTESKDLQQTVLKFFEKLEVMVDPTNVENCHWIKIKLWKRKDAAKIRSSNKKLKGMDLSSPGIRGKVYTDDILCKYLWKNVKACSQTNFYSRPLGY